MIDTSLISTKEKTIERKARSYVANKSMIEINYDTMQNKTPTPNFWDYVQPVWETRLTYYTLSESIREWLTHYNIRYKVKERFGGPNEEGYMFHGVNVFFEDPAHEMLFKLVWM